MLNTSVLNELPVNSALDLALDELTAAKDDWAQTSIEKRIAVLQAIKDCLLPIAKDWAETAGRMKGIPEDSALVGEEWISGPYTVMSACNGLLQTLSEMQGKSFLNSLKKRKTQSGQTAVQVLPHSIWDHLILSGVTAEVWMKEGITADNLASHTATSYDSPERLREGKVALVLGAGNIASIAPLDVFHKLFNEHQVVILKMNPVNEYLTEFLNKALKPLIDLNVLRIVKGGADVGGYLCEHPQVEEIHITGSGASHDIIVWGFGEEGIRNKAAGTPKLNKPITSELGAVCPTIVVPGPWSAADIQFQAENIATQKLHNSGFNCVACQMLILPKHWDKKQTLLNSIKNTVANLDPRKPYYPGAAERLAEFEKHSSNVLKFDRGSAPACLVSVDEDAIDDKYRMTEVFAPALSTHELADTDPEAYLIAAAKFANQKLYGTLGANIVIHPKTIKQIGKKRFEQILADLHYGTIAINTWSGLGFLTPACPWGAFPGHTLEDVQSGIGFAHNTYMFDSSERVVVQAPWRPFPRNLLSGDMTLLPKPPWFVSNKKQHKTAMLLTRFQHTPSWLKLPRIFFNALLG
ncbi:aldehyde dehydrogenase family protein [Aliiglaciecola sp. 2_MG-2023]|uniref:aldehyde dehydrogenase family protein n=1 Tax=unclassified Aliiglaciecola TaxID=2593648 RepID=UPI0026E2ACB7|nr:MULTISPECIES: aldehyde dehydrogenase family protein [unclassified Aliiglaciecola]MDO6709730.1 aldehyde dehydrogenase family protein [Aliiglaciecola sp. 2_MG-2023]MDO6750728.1 aldehyde dehydrogenase family protein [Aliiglaciecola sp. 1_MG-2023]